MDLPLAFVDLETTGTSAHDDRVTEIGIVRVDGHGLREWSSLVDPGRPIPPMIQSLTGISDAMVAGAPRFADIADEVAAQLDGHLFIAHNAAFDHGFLRQEFLRLGRAFEPEVLCTVRLSRKLYPQHRRHNLDSIIARHGLSVESRHRALDDARLLWQFWQSARRDFGDEHIAAAAAALSRRQHWPDFLDPELPGLMPDSHGVYVFYDGNGQALYVGKADKLRARILAHFQPMQRRAKAQRLAGQVRRVQWLETGGMLGALLHENRLMRELQPLHNRRSRGTPAAAAEWPYRGPIGLREGGVIHVVHRWQFLGSATRDDQLYELLEQAGAGFDPDVHRILRERIGFAVVVELGPA